MEKPKLTTHQLVAAIAGTSGQPAARVTAVLNALGGEAGKVLGAGGELVLPGLGRLAAQDRAAAPGRNPRTGEAIQIPARRVAKFTAHKALRDALAKSVGAIALLALFAVTPAAAQEAVPGPALAALSCSDTYLATTQTVTSGVITKVNVDTALPGGCGSSGWDAVNHRFNPQTAGKYHICATATMQYNTSGILYLTKNGTAGTSGTILRSIYSTGGSTSAADTCVEVSMNGSTNWVEMDVAVTSSGTPTVLGDGNPETTFSAFRIGP